MAMKPCRECKQEVSTEAKACPHCGAEKPTQAKQFSLGSLLVLIVFGIIVWNIVTPDEPSAPPPPKTAEQIRQDEISRGFSAWDGSHVQLERYIKKNLKDPDSYEHIETRYGDQGDYLLVSTSYRARNSFGGMVVGKVIAKAAIDGQLIEIVSSE